MSPDQWTKLSYILGNHRIKLANNYTIECSTDNKHFHLTVFAPVLDVGLRFGPFAFIDVDIL